jgi:hypothetical protein
LEKGASDKAQAPGGGHKKFKLAFMKIESLKGKRKSMFQFFGGRWKY